MLHRYHRQWIEAVRERYLEKDRAFKKKIHKMLVDYFSSRWEKGKPYFVKVKVNSIEKSEEKFADR